MTAKLAALQRNTREPNNENPKVTTAEHRISVGLIVREGTPRKADRFSRLQGSMPTQATLVTNRRILW